MCVFFFSAFFCLQCATAIHVLFTFFFNTRLNTFCLIDFVCVFCNAKDSFHLNFNKIRMHWSLLNYRNSYIKCKYNEISLTFFKIDKYQWYLVFVYITFFQNFIFSCAFRNMIDLQFPRTARDPLFGDLQHIRYNEIFCKMLFSVVFNIFSVNLYFQPRKKISISVISVK